MDEQEMPNMTTPPEDSRVQLTESALLEPAEQETGLRSFGEEDFRTGLTHPARVCAA